MNLLMILHTPPPWHGVTRINQLVVDSFLSRMELFDRVNLIDVCYSKKINSVEKFQVGKLFYFISIFFRVLISLPQCWFGKGVAYFDISPVGSAFIRDAVIALLLRAFGVRVLYHIHGRGIGEAAEDPKRRWLYQLVFNGSEVICLSDQMKEDLGIHIAPYEVFIVPNGGEDLRSELASQSEINQSKDRVLNILFLSSMMLAKGPLVLLEALDVLNRQGVPFKAVFAGEWWKDLDEESFQQRIAELKLESQVRYRGGVYGEEKKALFNNADIFVFPTLREAFGLVAIEAMSCGVPVVASDEGSLSYILDDTGLLFEKGNSSELAQQLIRLQADRQLQRELGIKSRQRFKSHFTEQVFIENMRGVFSSIVEKPRN